MDKLGSAVHKCYAPSTMASAMLQSAMASPEWRATIADIPNFAVLDKSWGALVDEISVV